MKDFLVSRDLILLERLYDRKISEVYELKEELVSEYGRCVIQCAECECFNRVRDVVLVKKYRYNETNDRDAYYSWVCNNCYTGNYIGNSIEHQIPENAFKEIKCKEI